MLLEYLTISGVSCVEMYLIFQSDNIVHFLRGGIFLCAALSQLSFYCIPAELVSSQALGVADSIYQSDWASPYIPDVRKKCVIVMILLTVRTLEFLNIRY
ncbi:hypothetical protein ILUMI_15343 [Ignelater luminosus]|uniref:Uncharacterized protein n=1 Tax=Ignelater luminosus TaxID=2038154 RepID=A0A8K0CWR1_IGNLU|nr:hypothetical protein ILUMI_15343 [Ignelater luminosus]